MKEKHHYKPDEECELVKSYKPIVIGTKECLCCAYFRGNGIDEKGLWIACLKREEE